MSTLVWPPISPSQSQHAEEEVTRARELEWLLAALQDTLQSLKAGLEECAALLAPKEPGSTLVLSSQRTEHLKGFLTRVGARVVKADVHLRVPSLPIPRGQNSFRLTLSPHPTAPTLVWGQLTTARTLINACLDVVDATRWTGDRGDANFIAAQLRLLHENMIEAHAALRGGDDGHHQKAWYDDPLDAAAFEPPLPATLALHLAIADAAVILTLRTLEPVYPQHHHAATAATGPGTASGTGGAGTPFSPTPSGSGASSSYTGFSLRERLASALAGVGGGAARPAFHDEAHAVFAFRGQDVRVRDKVRVESQDPSLMAAFAKLGALERNLAVSRRALDVVMGNHAEEEEA